jgi:phytol kinase
MPNSWLLLPVVIALLIVTMAVLSTARRAGQLSPEGARKAFHVAMGMMTLSFPWLFPEPAPVVLLACLCCAWFEAVRRMAPLQNRCGPVLSAVARPGRGEVHFAVGTALTFVLAGGYALAFCLPMAILALADSAAALVGRRYGGRPGTLRLGGKSLAGSSAFFAVALALSLIGLALDGWAAAPAVAMSLTLAATTTLLEAIARRGADNLLIPVGAALLLQGQMAPAIATVAFAVALGLIAIAGLTLGKAIRARGFGS